MLVVKMTVFVGYARHRMIFLQFDAENVISFAHTVTLGVKFLPIGRNGGKRIVVGSIGQFFYASAQIGGIQHGCAMPNA